MPNRVMPSRESKQVQHGYEYFTNIPSEIAKKYETSILDNLLKFIKSDEVLKHFHIRLVCECENIRKVVKEADEFDVQGLESDVEKLVNATTVRDISIFDSAFHDTLFRITKNTEFYKWWREQSGDLGKFLGKFWETVGVGSNGHRTLMDVHMKIFEAVKNHKEEAAVEAMQDHFSILLYQLLGTTYDRS